MISSYNICILISLQVQTINEFGWSFQLILSHANEAENLYKFGKYCFSDIYARNNNYYYSGPA